MTTRAKRRAAALLGSGILLLAAGIPAAANGPVERFTEDVTGDVFECEDATYTVTSGQINIVVHEGSSASGNQNFTFTLTPKNVVAEDESGNVVRIVGAIWEGGAFKAKIDHGVFTETLKLQIVTRGGGTVGSVNTTFHVTAQPNNFVIKDFDFGTCELP